MSEELPQVIHEGILEIGDLRLRVYTLDNGMRVIDADDMKPLLDGFLSLDEHQPSTPSDSK